METDGLLKEQHELHKDEADYITEEQHKPFEMETAQENSNNTVDALLAELTKTENSPLEVDEKWYELDADDINEEHHEPYRMDTVPEIIHDLFEVERDNLNETQNNNDELDALLADLNSSVKMFKTDDSPTYTSGLQHNFLEMETDNDSDAAEPTPEFEDMDSVMQRDAYKTLSLELTLTKSQNTKLLNENEELREEVFNLQNIVDELKKYFKRTEPEVTQPMMIRKHFDNLNQHFVSPEMALTAVNEHLLLHDGNLDDLADDRGYTHLHCAVEKNYFFVVEKLLDNKSNALAKTNEGEIPLQIALKNEYDEVAALIIRHMDKAIVRSLFTRDGGPPMIKVHDYLNKKFEKTVTAILNCMIETGKDGTHELFYGVLEADECGYEPNEESFDPSSDSAFQTLAKDGNKVMINHKLIRLLIHKKWKAFARVRFMVHAILYFLSLVCLTVCVVLDVNAANASVYGYSETARGVAEVMIFLYVCARMITKVFEIVRDKRQFFRDMFNIIELLSTIMLVSVVPVRFTYPGVHWYIFSVGYFLWVLLAFKYAAINRQAGAYAQILWHIIAKDLVQFGILFSAINLAFSGSFLLALKGDNNLNTHNETSSFWGILFVGLRTITEAQAVVDYVGSDGYKPLSSAIMLIFLFVSMVILLNILIAQMSDTYGNIQANAFKNVEVNMARIIARIEHQDLKCSKQYLRRKHYHRRETIIDFKRIQLSQDESLLNGMNETLKLVANKQVVNGTDIKTMKLGFKNVRTDVSQFKSDITQHGAKMANITENIDHFRKDIADIKPSVEGIKNNLDDLKNDTATIKEFLQQILDQIKQAVEAARPVTRYTQMQESLKVQQDKFGEIRQRSRIAADELSMEQLHAALESNAQFIPWDITDEADICDIIKSSSQEEALGRINYYFDRSKDFDVSAIHDDNGNTPLHCAVMKNYYFVTETLLDHNADTLIENKEGKIALEIALDGGHDGIGGLLVKNMDNESVIALFSRTETGPPKLKLRDFLKTQYESTVLAVLGCLESGLTEPMASYSLLEQDTDGNDPTDDGFNPDRESVFQALAMSGNKYFINHHIVRMMIKRKWNSFARTRFIGYAIFYLVSLFSLTFSLVTSVAADDPLVYNSTTQYARAVFEILTCAFCFLKLISETIQLIRFGTKYARDMFNLIEIVSSILLLSILPLRFTDTHAQWYIYSAGYFLWTLTVFKYAAVFRQTGAYAQILWHIIGSDVIQFSILLIMINIAFGGSFLLALKGDGDLHVHEETSSFWGVLLVGLRTMIEGEPVVDYTGSNGYRTVSTIIMLIFLFVTIVILLNILIAQLSDTYQRLQQEANLNLEVNLARIIARIEQNNSSFLGRIFYRQHCKIAYYKADEEIGDINTNVKSERNTELIEEMNSNVIFIAKKQMSSQLSIQTVNSHVASLQEEITGVKDDLESHKAELKEVSDNMRSMMWEMVSLWKPGDSFQKGVNTIKTEIKKLHEKFNEIRAFQIPRDVYCEKYNLRK